MNTYEITYLKGNEYLTTTIYADSDQDARSSFMRRYPTCAITNITNLEDEDFHN